MQSLDLRKLGSLTIEDSKRISFLAESVGIEYNNYIGEIIELNNIEGLQFIPSVVCRNTYMSKIYDRMCRLALLEDRLKSGEIYAAIIIDTKRMKEPIRFLLDKYHSSASIKVLDNQLLRFSLIYPLYSLLRNFYICLNLWFWPKIVRFKNSPINEIYFLDTFIFKHSFNKNLKFNDRYYRDLVDNLELRKKNKTWFLPTLHGFRFPWEWLKLFLQVSKSKENIMMKERWLKSNDYIFSIWKSITLGNAIKNIPIWRDINISKLVKEEVFLERGSFSITQALLIYRFFKRLKDRDVKVNGVIDWYENQNIDRVLCLGLREYHPQTKIKGYLGFIPENYYLGISPVKYEQIGGVLPDEILVIGDAFVPTIKKYLSKMNVSVAPAFRFQDTIHFKKDNNIQKNIILLAMPMLVDEAKTIIELARNAWHDKKYKWLIKVHPTISKNHFQNIVPESLDIQFEFTEEKITDLFQKTHLLVTSGSSVCLEALICGVSVAIIGSRSGPTINPLQGVVDKEYWSVCYSSQELVHVIEKVSIKTPLRSEKYLSKVSLDKVKEMMKF